MTNEEAIVVLQKIKPIPHRGDGKSVTHTLEIIAIDKAIKALEQQPCEDCISRKEVNVLVDELARAISDERCFISRGRSTAAILQDILDLPSVTPQPCEDCISRADVLDLAKKGVLISNSNYQSVCKAINELLSVTPIRKNSISRQAVYEQINYWIGSGEYRYTNATDYLIKRITDIESLEQQLCEDCISREKAKQFLYERIDRLNDDELYDIFSRIIDDMYNELPPVTPSYNSIKTELKSCEDCISREAVLDLVKKGVLVSNGNYESVCKAINDLPSVTPKYTDEDIDRAQAVEQAYIDKAVELEVKE